MDQMSELEKVVESGKKAYVSPKLTEWGTLNELTLGGEPSDEYVDSDWTTYNPFSTGHV